MSSVDTLFQIAYVEVPMVTVGSMSYAEDDDRHYLGIKAAVVSKDGRSQYVCYVVECDNEVRHDFLAFTL